MERSLLPTGTEGVEGDLPDAFVVLVVLRRLRQQSGLLLVEVVVLRTGGKRGRALRTRVGEGLEG